MAENLTERQAKWFATIRDGLERDTGKPLDRLDRDRPDLSRTKHRARLKWFKEDSRPVAEPGLARAQRGVRRARWDWSEPTRPDDTLWSDAATRAIFEAVREVDHGPPRHH